MKTTSEIFYGNVIPNDYDKTQSIMQLGWIDWPAHAKSVEIAECLTRNNVRHQIASNNITGNFNILMHVRFSIYDASIVIDLIKSKNGYMASIIYLKIGPIYEWQWPKNYHKSYSIDSRKAIINAVAKGIHLIEEFLAQSNELGRHLDIAKPQV